MGEGGIVFLFILFVLVIIGGAIYSAIAAKKRCEALFELAARRFYNGNVRDYRNKCETFPSNVVARMFGFQAQEFFSVPPSVKEVPDVEFARQGLTAALQHGRILLPPPSSSVSLRLALSQQASSLSRRAGKPEGRQHVGKPEAYPTSAGL
jgi:hypothetical protein